MLRIIRNRSKFLFWHRISYFMRMDARKNSGNILVIEDDINDQQLFELACHHENIPYPVKFFADPVKALDYLLKTNDRIFLIVCDMNMPKMNGMELKKEVDQHIELKQKSIPFIFMSTSASDLEVGKAYELGVQGYFYKGANFDDLCDTVRLMVKYWQKCRQPRQ